MQTGQPFQELPAPFRACASGIDAFSSTRAQASVFSA
jgi:hypothetical protein